MFKRLLVYPRKAMVGLAQRRQILLVAMFATLHLALLQDVTSDAGRILLLPHFALFLLWQPFVSAQLRIPGPQIFVTIALLLVAALSMSWVLIGLWLVLLAGMVGGRVFFHSTRGIRLFYLLALTYLIVMLLLYVLPHAIPKVVVPELLMLPLAHIGAPAIIGAMFLMPRSLERDRAREAIDLVYSMFVMLMLAVLVLGTISFMLLQQLDYLRALLVTLFGMAVTLFMASWLWNPVGGFSGIGAFTSRYLLSIGLPFEQWIRSLADLAQREPDPRRFLDRACADLAEQLPWVTACRWEDGAETGGTLAASNTGKDFQNVFHQDDLTLTLATPQPLAPMLVWHLNLVAQLVARFYMEKKRDRQLREMAYVQAVHETGARVTHDVKNLLQSLNALLFIIGKEDKQATPESQALLRRQLPLIAQRLQQTLDKLRVPEAEEKEMQRCGAWWNELTSRYAGMNVQFDFSGDRDRSVPAALFTSAAENLLQNAFDKRAGDPAIGITVILDATSERPVLSVMDTGTAVPAGKAADIGLRPLVSENGLGIGLYQLSRLGALGNHRLELTANKPGKVCFSLRPSEPD